MRSRSDLLLQSAPATSVGQRLSLAGLVLILLFLTIAAGAIFPLRAASLHLV
mgnify:CR=1 FL=1